MSVRGLAALKSHVFGFCHSKRGALRSSRDGRNMHSNMHIRRSVTRIWMYTCASVHGIEVSSGTLISRLIVGKIECVRNVATRSELLARMFATHTICSSAGT